MTKYYFMFVCILIYSNLNAAIIEFPVYGNWCGPGFPAMGENPTPTDIVDEACRVHDLKYNECERVETHLECQAAADLELVHSLRKNVGKFDRFQLIVANNLARYFVVQAPVKVKTEKINKIFKDRFRVSTDLKDRAEYALMNLGGKFNTINGKLMHLKNIIVDKANRVTGGVTSKNNKTQDAQAANHD